MICTKCGGEIRPVRDGGFRSGGGHWHLWCWYGGEPSPLSDEEAEAEGKRIIDAYARCAPGWKGAGMRSAEELATKLVDLRRRAGLLFAMAKCVLVVLAPDSGVPDDRARAAAFEVLDKAIKEFEG
jgi:hypothetical protein